MTEGGPLVNIDLGSIAAPATKLIEKVSDAVGGVAKPWQTERVAKAEAKADLVRAEARIQISEMEERALQRMVREEGKRQENIESITAKAIPNLKETADPESVDDDWITNFFDKARLISDAQMQELWASVLSGEANKPGSFTKRTIELVASLEKSDAELISKLCSRVWMMGGPTALIFESEMEATADPLKFTELKHLDSLGVIDFESLTGFQRTGFVGESAIIYFGRPVIWSCPSGTENFELGKVLLTRAGVELAHVVPAKPNKHHFERVLKQMIEKNYQPFVPLGTKEIQEKW